MLEDLCTGKTPLIWNEAFEVTLRTSSQHSDEEEIVETECTKCNSRREWKFDKKAKGNEKSSNKLAHRDQIEKLPLHWRFQSPIWLI